MVMIVATNVSHGCNQPIIETSSSVQQNISKAESSSQKQIVHFRTYGTDDYAWSKLRILQEALDTGWFASAKALGPDDLTAEFKKRFEDILKQPRGGGYWIWKYDVIEQAVETMNEGDFLVYLDAGCQVNKNKRGEERFREYLKIVNESQYDMLCFDLGHAEQKYTTEKIFGAFNVSTEDPLRLSGQIVGGVLLMQKGPHLRSWLKIVKDALLRDPWIITDKYNKETMAVTKAFKDNRHDQSLSSVSRKINGCEMITDESYPPSPDFPFQAARLKKPP